MHVSPATDGAAVVVWEGHALFGKTDGPDERRPLHAATILLLQFDENWSKWEVEGKNPKQTNGKLFVYFVRGGCMQGCSC